MLTFDSLFKYEKTIHNATIANEGKIFSSDVLITNGRIENIAPHISVKFAVEEINADGKYLLPADMVLFIE
ncbi:MAG: hypothetical protein LH473_10680 [Chitinophagales bacterium]|nr:hypothetical protein [Chitinophagales bacterium]